MATISAKMLVNLKWSEKNAIMIFLGVAEIRMPRAQNLLII